MRQRLDDAASGFRPVVDFGSFQKFHRAGADNGQDGYAPAGSYLGAEDWCLELELREGKQHSQCEFIPFLKRVLTKSRNLTSRKILVRLDSAHDAIKTRATLADHEDVSFILK